MCLCQRFSTGCQVVPQGVMDGLEGSMEAKGVIGGNKFRGVMKSSVCKVYINLMK